VTDQRIEKAEEMFEMAISNSGLTPVRKRALENSHATLLSTIASLQRDIDLAEHQRDRGWEERDELKREVEQWKERHTTVVGGYNKAIESYDQARAAVQTMTVDCQTQGCREWMHHENMDKLEAAVGRAAEHMDRCPNCCGSEILTDTGGKGE